LSDFEYLRNLPIGQVVPGSSPIHHLDPRARIVCFTLVLGAAIFSTHPFGLLLALAAMLAGLWLARLPFGYALRSLLSPLPFLLILAVFQIFFNALPDTGPALLVLGPLVITPADLLAGGMLLLRFGVLVLGISFATQVLSTSEMSHGTEALFAPLEKIGLPVHDGVMALVIAVRFLPFLAQSAERIAKAQAARGAEWAQGKGGLVGRVRMLLPLLVPVFVTSLRRAETMALAMDARGYASRAHPTALVELHFMKKDAIAIGLALAMAAAILII
jgi:energy-coupling factor transport system permease protein